MFRSAARAAKPCKQEYENKEKNKMSDPLSFLLFFFVVVPFLLIHLQNKRKSDKELLALQKESNRLLAEIAGKLSSNT